MKETLESLGFKAVLEDSCIFTNGRITLFFFVDDIIMMFRHEYLKEWKQLDSSLWQNFSMKGRDDVSWFLSLRIIRDRTNRRMWLSQEEYVDKITTSFSIDHDSKEPPEVPLSSHVRLQPPSADKELDEERIKTLPRRSQWFSSGLLVGRTRHRVPHELDTQLNHGNRVVPKYTRLHRYVGERYTAAAARESHANERASCTNWPMAERDQIFAPYAPRYISVLGRDRWRSMFWTREGPPGKKRPREPVVALGTPPPHHTRRAIHHRQRRLCIH